MSKFTQEDLLNAMGLKVGDKVRIFGQGIYKVITTELDGIGLSLENPETDQWKTAADDLSIEFLIGSEYSVVTPPKYTLTETEKHIVLAIDEKWKWIARDDSNCVRLFQSKPIKGENNWSATSYFFTFLNCFNHHFQFIQWSDTEPVSLDELREIAKK